MKTALTVGNELLLAVLREHWGLDVCAIHFIPVGNSAYSYKVVVEPGANYYLKIADRQTARGRETATRMLFSLPTQRFVSDHALPQFSAPAPQYTLQKTLSATQGALLFALYTFVDGKTLADAYPLSSALLRRFGETLAALHTLQIPEELRRQSPQDNLTAAFDDALLADLRAVEQISAQAPPYLQQLKEIMQPWHEYIRAFLARSYEYKGKAQRTMLPGVLCHGDPWGGNIIPSPGGQLVLLDWESAVIAPAERDAYSYIGYTGEDFVAFTAGYHKVRKEPAHWNGYLLAYYAHRHQMRNLASWLHDLLHENHNDEQCANDLEMIEQHCLDRLESVERVAASLKKDESG